MKLRHSARTDVGRTRDHNEDSFGVGDPKQAEHLGSFFVVCDGMGGHAAGEVASSMAVEHILSGYYADPAEDRAKAIQQAFALANSKVYAQGRGSMGTTGVAALLYHDALHIANVGDSRAYLIRNHQIIKRTRDHSFVSDQVEAGLITPEQARLSPHRNVITRALGYQPEVAVDMLRMPIQPGDMVLLCSDGLHGLVDDDELISIATSQSVERAVDQLIDLANKRGGTDNITAMLIEVEELDWDLGTIPDDSTDDIHERKTDEIAVLDLPTMAAAKPKAAPPPATQPIAASPATSPTERPLTLWGGLLATLLLAALLLGILTMLPPAAELQPATTPIATQQASTPAPTVQQTTPTPVPTTAPTANLFPPVPTRQP